MKLSFQLEKSTNVMISYETILEGIRVGPANPLPKEGNSDIVQIRCIINGVPFRPSSAFTSSYGVEMRVFTKLANSFVVPLMSNKTHEIIMQWKKLGKNIQRWFVTNSGSHSAFNLIANADFQSIHYQHESQDIVLASVDSWKTLTSPLSFHLPSESYVTVGYSLVVQPQLLTFIKDRAVEYVSIRALIDGVAYTESAETFGTNAWNPMASSLRNSMRLKLLGGNHSVVLQWKKMGAAFKSWTSNPSYLDGFTSSRNVIVTVDKFYSPVLMSHDRHTLTNKAVGSSSGTWHVVNNKTLEIHLIKESALLIRYALPVTQAENPNFDSNLWKPMAEVDARIVVDGIGYTYRGGTSLTSSSRRFETMFGSLPIVLKAGTHSISLQWRSDKVAWTTLNDINGFSHSDTLLTFISSANAQPIISTPVNLTTNEDQILRIDSIRVDDIDAELEAGMVMAVNVSVDHGTLMFPNLPLLANSISFEHSEKSSKAIFVDNVANINSALQGMVYIPPSHFFGRDSLHLSISDKGGIGNGPALTDVQDVEIAVNAIDNMFTLEFPSGFSFQIVTENKNSSNEVLLSGIILNDIDSIDSYFQAEITSSCGFIRVESDNHDVVFQRGRLHASSRSIVFYAKYLAMKMILESGIFFVADDSSCTSSIHKEIVALSLTNQDNVLHSILGFIVVDLIRQPIIPSIVSPLFPRWSLNGIEMDNTFEVNSGRTFKVDYFPLTTTDKTVVNSDNKDELVLTSQQFEAPMSQVVVLDSGLMTYAFEMNFGVARASILGSSYIHLDMEIPIRLKVENMKGIGNMSCLIGDESFPIVVDLAKNEFVCRVLVTESKSVASRSLSSSVNDSFATSSVNRLWMKVVQGNVESNYVQLHVLDRFEITKVSTAKILPLARSVIELIVSEANVNYVGFCLFDGLIAVPSVRRGIKSIACEVPNELFSAAESKDSLSIQVSSADKLLVSPPVAVSVLPVPRIQNATLVLDASNGAIMLETRGDWFLKDLQYVGFSHCYFDGYQLDVAFHYQDTLYCIVNIGYQEVRHCCDVGSETCQVLHQFDGLATNVVNATCDPSIFTPKTDDILSAQYIGSSNYQFESTFVSFYTDTSKVGIVGSRCLLGKVSVPALITDLNILSCSLPKSESAGQMVQLVSLSGELLAVANVDVAALPQFTHSTPNHGSLSGGTFITVTSDMNISAISEYECLFGSSTGGELVVSVPAIVINSTAISCLTPSYPPGRTTLQVAVNKLLSNALWFQFDDPVYVDDVKPSHASLIGGSTITVSGAGFSNLLSSPHCRFGKISVQAMVINDTLLTCVAPYMGSIEVVEFRVEAQGIVRYRMDFSFSFRDPYVIVSAHPKKIVIGSTQDFIVRGFGFVASSQNVNCIFNMTTTTGVVLNSTAVHCFLPLNISIGSKSVTLKFDEYYLSDQTTDIEIVQLPSIVQFYPNVAFRGSRMVYSIVAQHLDKSLSYQCTVDGHSGVVKVIEHEAMTCTIFFPSSVEKNITHLLVSANDFELQFRTGDNVLHVMNSPTIDHVYPLAGVLHGGEIVKVSGSGIWDLQGSNIRASLRCRFGSLLTPAILDSAGYGVACITPSVERPQRVSFGVLLQDMSIGSLDFNFRYLNPIKVFAINRKVGSIDGGEFVVVRGLSFVADVPSYCHFGNQSIVPARWVNDTALECVVPPSSFSGQVDLSVRFEGYNGGFQTFAFEYEVSPTVTEIKPLMGSSFGGSNITVVGQGFKFTDLYSCSFHSGLTVQSVYIDENTLICTSPVGFVGEYELRVQYSDTGVSLKGKSSTMFQIVDFVTVMWLEPSSGPTSGSTVVHVVLNDVNLFKSYAIANISCHFGDQVAPSSWVGENELKCSSPTSDAAGAVDFSLSLNGVAISLGSHRFTYTDDLLLTRFYPAIGSIDGTTLVKIYGYGFSQDDAFCNFGNSSRVPANVVDSQTLVCTAPASLLIESVALSIEVGGQKETFEQRFRYVPAIFIQRSYPSRVFSHSKSLYIEGVGFEHSNILECVINDIRAQSHLLNDSILVCDIPQTTVGKASVSVLANGVEVNSSGVLTVQVLPTPSIYLVSPSSGFALSSVPLRIQGQGLVIENQPIVRCVVGPYVSVATITESDLLCNVELGDIRGSFPVLLEYSELGVVSSDQTFSIGESIQVFRMSPSQGIVSAVTHTVIHGIHFDRGVQYGCDVSGHLVTAAYINSTAVICYFETATVNLVGPQSISLIANGNKYPLVDHFIVLDKGHVDFIHPLEGSLQGGLTLTVEGSNFYTSDRIMCQFGDIRSEGKLLSSSVINCIVPPSHSPRAVDVEVWIDNVRLSSGPLQFSYYPPAILQDIYPKLGVVVSGTHVVLSGKNFLSSTTYHCQIMGLLSPATFVSTQQVSCLLPSVNNTITLQVFLVYMSGQNEVIASNGIEFRFVDMVVMHGTNTRYLYLHESHEVSIYGQNFPYGASMTCKLQGREFYGIVLDLDTVSCLFSGLSSPVKAAQITLDFMGLLVNQFPVSIDIIEKPLIGSFDPKVVSSYGGTTISVSGSSFSVFDVMYCQFGLKRVFATVTDSHSLSCVTPSLAVGVTEFSVELAGSPPSSSIMNISVSAVPYVSSIAPLILSDGVNVSVQVHGQGLRSSLATACNIQDQSTPLYAVDDFLGICHFEASLIAGVNQTFSIAVDDGAVVIFSSSIDIVARGFANDERYSILPRYGPANRLLKLRIETIDSFFYAKDSYSCLLNGTFSPAIVISAHMLECTVHTGLVSGEKPVVIKSQTTGAEFLSTLMVVGDLTIDYVDSNFVEESNEFEVLITMNEPVDFSNIDVDWECVVNGYNYNAVQYNISSMACLVPASTFCNDKTHNIDLRTVDRIITISGTYAVDENFCSSVLSSSSLGEEVLQVKHLFVNETKYYEVAMSIKKSLVHQARRNDNMVISPPKFQLSELDYSNLVSFELQSKIDQTPQVFLAKSINQRHCVLNSKLECLEVIDADSFFDNGIIVSSHESSLSMMNHDNSSLRQLSLPLIESVYPIIVSSSNYTWVKISGRNFWHGTTCRLNNVTLITTSFISSTLINCLVPPMVSRQTATVTLTVHNSEFEKSIVTTELWYEVAMTANFRTWEAPKDRELPETESSRSTSLSGMIGMTDVCLSEHGCVGGLISSVGLSSTSLHSMTWESRTVSTSFGNNSRNGLNFISWNESFGMNLMINNITGNFSFSHSDNGSGYELTNNEDTRKSKVYVVYPTSMPFPCMNCFITFLGNDLYLGNPWCVKLDDFEDSLSPCFLDERGNKIYCEMVSTAMMPRVYNLNLLSQCTEVVYHIPFNVTLPSEKRKRTSSVMDKSLEELTVLTDRPTIKEFHPAHGMVVGGTLLTVTVSNAMKIRACYFGMETSFKTTPVVSLLSETMFTCQSPPVNVTGKFKFGVLTDSQELVDSVFSFDFKETPTFFGAVPSMERNSSIMVFGLGFSSFDRVYCRMMYSNDYNVVLSGRIYSDGQIECLGLPYTPKRRLLSVSLSFNSVEFLQVIPVEAIKSFSSSINSLSLGMDDVFVPVQLVYKGLSFDQTTHLNQINLKTLQWSCSKVNYVTVPLTGVVVDSNYSCRINDQVISTPILTTSNHSVCVVQPMKPGSYRLSLVSENILHAPIDMMIQCFPEPKISNVNLLPLDLDDTSVVGSSRLSVIAIDGLNFRHGMMIKCSLDDDIRTSVVDSTRSLLCSYQHILPGSHEFYLLFEGRVLVRKTVCVTEDMIRLGSALEDVKAEQCEKAMSQEDIMKVSKPVSSWKSIEYQIRSFTPQSGLTSGLTQVTVVADRINFRSDIYCLFDDDQITEALVTDLDYVICRTPPSLPGNHSLVLKSNDGISSWCCGWFYFYPPGSLRSVDPSTVDGSGGNIVTLEISNMAIDAELFCHMNDEIIKAMKVNSTHLSCRLPALYEPVAMLSYGSYAEKWSNELPIMVLRQNHVMKISPWFGTKFGGSSVLIDLPPGLNAIRSPKCKFGTAQPDQGVLLTDHSGLMTVSCITPPAEFVGAVDVYLIDGNSTYAPIFFAGVYTYLYPPQILSVDPARFQREKNVDILVSGEYFYDNDLLSCFITTNGTDINGKQFFVAAKWLSERLIICPIRSEMTIATDELTIAVTNNRVDISSASFTMSMSETSELMQAIPSRGFINGGTNIRIAFKKEISEQLYCSFEGIRSVAILVDLNTLLCISPRQQRGHYNVSVVDLFGNHHGYFSFEFCDIPTFLVSSNSSILRNKASSVTFNGILPVGGFGRLVTVDPVTVVHDECVVSHNSMVCEDVIFSGDEDLLYLDITANGQEFISKVAVVPVFQPSVVLWTDPLFALKEEGGYFTLQLNEMTAGAPTVCKFDVYYENTRKIMESPAIEYDENVIRCDFAAFPMDSEVYFSLWQYGNIIFGPKITSIVDSAFVDEVKPTHLVLGMPSTIMLSFKNPVSRYPQMALFYEHQRIPLTMINNSFALATVESVKEGDHDVVLLYETMNNFAKSVGRVTVVDYFNDISVNTTIIARSRSNELLLNSKKCLLNREFVCTLEQGLCHVNLINNCSASMILFTDTTKLILSLRVCAIKECLDPVFVRSVDVVPGMTVIVAQPGVGPTLGGALIHLHGSGFVNDPTLQCAFGDLRSPAVVESSTRLQCILPPASSVGLVDVHVIRKGVLVTRSVATFNYIPHLSNITVSPSFVSALGGTPIYIQTFGKYDWRSRQHLCRFNEKYVDAAVFDDATLVCVAPSFDVDKVEFAVSLENSDVSVPRQLIIRPSLNAIYVEPTIVPPMGLTNITILFENLGDIFDSTMSEIPRLSCFMDNEEVQHWVDDDMFIICEVEDLASGEHGLSILLDEVLIFSQTITSRQPFFIDSVYPLYSFMSESISVQVSSSQGTNQEETNEYTACCFGDYKSPSVALAGSSWQCFSPKVNLGGLMDTVYLPVGLMKADGFCEYSGFTMTLLPTIEFVNQSVSSGSIFGNTAVLLESKFRMQGVGNVFCRIGTNMYAGEYVQGEGVLCVTRPAPPGIYSIDISVNGIDFVPTGMLFEYILPTPDDTEYSVVETGVKPVLLYTSEVYFPSSSQFSFTVYGANFNNASHCILTERSNLQQQDPSTSSQWLQLETLFISNKELSCVLPVHSPGKVDLWITTDNLVSAVSVQLEFVATPSLSLGIYKIAPEFGPRNSLTTITVTLENLFQYVEDLFCIVGDERVFTFNRTAHSVQCSAPANSMIGKVPVRLASHDGSLLDGLSFFEYIDDPMLFDINPKRGTINTELVVSGLGFTKFSSLSIQLGIYDVPCAIISNTKMICQIPSLPADNYPIVIQTNGQHVVSSGSIFEYFSPVQLSHLWPLNGPALKGGTLLSVYSSNVPENIDIFCLIDTALIPANVLSNELIQCRTPPHRPGRVRVSLIGNSVPLNAANNTLEFMYAPDVSVDKITPEFGYTSGDFPVFVFGSNFVNTSSLGCRFADMKSRAIYLSNNSLVCLSPSPIGRPELKDVKNVPVEVTVNGYDFSESRVMFSYSEPCDQGFFCPGMSRQLCPNGTYCPVNSRNFTLCAPGYFQPKEGQIGCVICPVGYICPDMGMSRPVICPPGLICDSMGLRASAKLCPAGRYCLNGTKASSLNEFKGNPSWVTDYVTGVAFFNESTYDWKYRDWPSPAVGKSRPLHPPELSCDGLVCSGGSTNVLAEAPFPCPIGHYCRAGAGTQIPMPKNFSSPQRCYDGFFCPRGSVSPEGSGPCPNGYFCPTQIDAIICPAGHYCPGVGNRDPIECYPGTFNPLAGQANCTVCPTGHICPGWGLLLPEPCPAGFVCLSLGLSYPVVLCPQGYRCYEGTLTLDPSDTTTLKPYVCKEGEFCLGGVSQRSTVDWIPSQPYGVTHPQLCSEGTYCQAGAYLSSGSGLCFKGHYCPPNSSFPTETPVGNFASGLGSVAPTLCYPGTYAPLNAQVNCLPCPSGHSCISYGTYIPTICLEGTYRSQVDSVTCTTCPTGTYSYEVGSPDLSLCLPCPKGRICGIKRMTTLKASKDCPAGYICGYGTDRSSQFTHLTPAGFHTPPNTSPEDQYKLFCQPGYYCPRGTATYMQYGGKCPVGSYCPLATPAAVTADTKCPLYTVSLGGSDEVQDCRIGDINVCDKARIDENKPMEDLTYYNTFEYTTLDDSRTKLSFDSSTSATVPTGEVQVVAKIYPTNLTASSPLWVNDTIEAFRTCPLYGSGAGNDKIIVIGRNFRDTKLNYCRFRACFSANDGQHPRRCKNQIRKPTGEVMDKIGNVSAASYVTRARYLSPTRMECETPEFLFDYDFNPYFEKHNYKCMYLDAFGNEVTDQANGNFSYVRPCDKSAATCRNLPWAGYEFFISLTFACTTSEILGDICAGLPEPGYMFNPCMSAEVLVEVTNDGVHYTTGDDLNGVSLISTVRYWDHNTMYNNFKNFTINATAAVFTYVYPQYFYQNSGIMSMETQYCRLPRYSEEGEREREKGWFRLQANHAAHVHIDFEHLPANLVYDEHFRIAIFMQPSRCTIELCDMSRVRLSPEEFLPCRKPKELPYWFQQTDIPKNVRNNFTVYALDDLLFKVEIHLLYGLYTAYAPLFDNTTTIRIASPGRSKASEGLALADIPTRNLTKYISFEERKVRMEYIFCAVVYQIDNTLVSQPLNLPPLYSKYERGRALIMFNVTKDQDQVRLHLDSRSDVQYGVEFWLMPATTPDESKELLDAYFETFQQTKYDSVNGYQFDFQSLVIPYFPYFSNCYTFDSYIPIWLALEGKECALPDFYPKSWNRYKFPALPDQDDIRFVGPFDFFEEPVADWCERDLYCNYEEDLGGQDNTPRWFETESGTSLFVIIRTPLNYFQYTGRGGTHISRSDAGGGKAAEDLLALSGDNFIPVSVDHSLGDVISGCVFNCFARAYTLTIAYYQEDMFNKRIVSASLAGDMYDFNQDDTSYSLHISYYPLGFLDLILNFAFDLSIFIVIFIFVGFMTVLMGFISWAFTRATTLLQNPPALRIWSMLALTVPPPLAGVTLGVIPIWFMTSMGNYYINGMFYTDPNSPESVEVGLMTLDAYPLEYGTLGAAITTTQMEQARAGRIGAMFFIIAFFSFYASSKMYFPRDESKRELEIAKKRTKLAEKEDLWKPILWKKANFMFSSFVLATILVCMVELSYWTMYGDFFYQVFVMLTIMNEVVVYVCDAQLNDTMLVAPLNCGYVFVQGLVGFGAPDFLSFLLSNFVDFAITNFSRVYQDFYLGFIFGAFQFVFDTVISIGQKLVPKYLSGSKSGSPEEKAKKEAEAAEQDFRKRSVEGVVTEDDESESVEPILEYLADIASDTFVVFYFPFFVYLLMQYRDEIQIPVVYGIRQSDMMIYLVFQLFLIAFQPFIDILNHSQNELFHGWKIYEYLVYSRYRFLQRETRWKGMETSLDECIEEKLRRLDQMCFSSQYFLMLTVHVNGIIYLVLAYENWLFWDYSPFSDSGFFLLFGFLTAVFIAFEWVIMFLAIRLKVWRIKHESTAWHLQQKEEDELDVPAWEEIKGASTEAFLMNQRITSETFRYKFLNYNRTWLINQLPQILTPRTMRRSRPYLINQFARIINARRDDISDDSDEDKDKKFGPVALTAPSRNIIRHWLGKARRRLRLRSIVEPLIKRARGSQCEQCLSRKQLQIEYEVDVDAMATMYDNAYPDDEEGKFNLFLTLNHASLTLSMF